MGFLLNTARPIMPAVLRAQRIVLCAIHHAELLVCAKRLAWCSTARCRLAEEGLPLLGAFPEDAMLRGVRLDEVLPALEAQRMFGSNVVLDQVRRWQHVLKACVVVVLACVIVVLAVV